MSHGSTCPCVPCLRSTGRGVTIAEAAALLGCDAQRVYQFLRGGLLKAAPKFGRTTYVLRRTIDDLLTEPRDLRGPRRPRRPRRQEWEAFDRYLANEYGIDAEDWARFYERQDGKCPGCCTDLRFDSKTHVDHDHVTGRVRGLLCNDCNLALGHARDLAPTLRRLAAYLDSI